MHRRNLFRNAALLGAGLSFSHPTESFASDDCSDARARISKLAQAGLAMQRRDWEQGILAQAFLESGDNDAVICLTRAAIVQRVPDGRLGVVLEGGPTDPAMGGAAYWHAAKLTRDPEIQQAVQGLLDWILHNAPRDPDGILYHVFDHRQVWSDGFNGAPPFLAATGHYNEALHQIDGFRKRLWDPHKKLLAHIWDGAPNAQNKMEFWGGGNGWAAAGLARVIRSLPADRIDDRKRLASFVSEILDGCLAHQRPDGLFHDVIDQPDTFAEADLGQMLAFAIYTGIQGDWLDKKYLSAADRMRSAARAKVDSFGFVQSVCGAPNFDRPGTSTEAQAFAIMMESSSAKLAASHYAS